MARVSVGVVVASHRTKPNRIASLRFSDEDEDEEVTQNGGGWVGLGLGVWESAGGVIPECR